MPILPTVRPLPYHSASVGGRDASLARVLCLTLLLVLMLSSSGCRSRAAGAAGSGADGTANTVGVAGSPELAEGMSTSGRGAGAESGARLQPPDVPTSLTDPQQRVEYLAEHYWQHFDFGDTTLISNADYTEQAFVDFIYLLPNVSETSVRRAVGKLIGSAAAASNPAAASNSVAASPGVAAVAASPADLAIFDHFTELAERYLYDPNSPMRNEELYIPFLEAIIALPTLDDVYKIRPRHQLALALKNRPGAVAADFAYTTASGRTGRLSKMQGDYTLLLFYDPDCPDCKRVKQYISDSEVFGALIGGQEDKRLSVLAVYPDADLDAWRKHLSDIPPAWTVGYDKGQVLRNKELYDLRAIPTLYLLDRNKRVLLKDASVEQIEAWLAQNTLG